MHISFEVFIGVFLSFAAALGGICAICFRWLQRSMREEILLPATCTVGAFAFSVALLVHSFPLMYIPQTVNNSEVLNVASWCALTWLLGFVFGMSTVKPS